MAPEQMSTWERLSTRFPAESDAERPAGRSMGLRRTALLWLAANMVVTTLLTGTLFVPGIRYGSALVAIVLGTLVGGAVLILVGVMGTRTGLPTMVLSRGAFGPRGGYLPAAFNLVVLMGWSWVQALLAGITLNHVVERATGFSHPVLFAVLAQSAVVLLALFGHVGIQRVEPWLAVAMVLVAGYVLLTAFRRFGPAEFLAIPEQPEVGMTGVVAFDLVVATAISWTVLAADVNRHAVGARKAAIGTALGYTASTCLAMVLGATALGYVHLAGGAAPAFDPTVLVEAFGIPLAAVVFVSVMATNTMVVYGMVMSYLNLRPRTGFLGAALVIGAVSIVGATWQGLLDRFIDFLFVISGLFVPVFAIMLVDYWVLRRGRYSVADLVSRPGAYWYTGGVNPVALAAFAVGAALAYYWTQVAPLPFGATIPVFAVSAAAYLGGSLLTGRRPASGATGAGR